MAADSPSTTGSSTTTESSGSRRVFVGNLSYRVSWQDLKDHMRSAGEVVYANVFTNEGQSRGCGVVEYATPAEALKAQQTLHDTTLGDRKIFVREDREDKEVKSAGFRGGRGRGGARGGGRGDFGDRGARGVKVLVSGLPPTTSWQDLKDYFQRYGSVSRADVSRDGDGSLSFANVADARSAVEKLNGSTFRGQTITVRLVE